MMQPANPTTHAVVIAGGGLTGLMLAGELALARVDVAIFERRASQDVAGAVIVTLENQGEYRTATAIKYGEGFHL